MKRHIHKSIGMVMAHPSNTASMLVVMVFCCVLGGRSTACGATAELHLYGGPVLSARWGMRDVDSMPSPYGVVADTRALRSLPRGGVAIGAGLYLPMARMIALSVGLGYTTKGVGEEGSFPLDSGTLELTRRTSYSFMELPVQFETRFYLPFTERIRPVVAVGAAPALRIGGDVFSEYEYGPYEHSSITDRQERVEWSEGLRDYDVGVLMSLGIRTGRGLTCTIRGTLGLMTIRTDGALKHRSMALLIGYIPD
jgi:hypothetical protein